MNTQLLQIFGGWNDTPAQQASMGAIIFLLPVVIILLAIGLILHKKYIVWFAILLAILYLINLVIIAPPLFK